MFYLQIFFFYILDYLNYNHLDNLLLFYTLFHNLYSYNHRVFYIYHYVIYILSMDRDLLIYNCHFYFFHSLYIYIFFFYIFHYVVNNLTMDTVKNLYIFFHILFLTIYNIDSVLMYYLNLYIQLDIPQ